MKVLAFFSEFRYSVYCLWFLFIFYFLRFFTIVSTQFSFIFFWLNDFYFFFLYPINSLYINNLLCNPITNTHPLIFLFIFYSFLSFLLCILFFSLIRFLVFVNRTFVLVVWVFFFTSVSFLLGCWWAYQESYWGGWWAWEASELLLLFFISSLVLFIHTFNFFHTDKFFFLFYLSFSFFLLYLTLLSLYFSTNLHSFFLETAVLDLRHLLYCLLFCNIPVVSFKKLHMISNLYWPVQLFFFIFLIKKVFFFYFFISIYFFLIFNSYPTKHLIVFTSFYFTLFSSFTYLF